MSLQRMHIFRLEAVSIGRTLRIDVCGIKYFQADEKQNHEDEARGDQRFIKLRADERHGKAAHTEELLFFLERKRVPIFFGFLQYKTDGGGEPCGIYRRNAALGVTPYAKGKEQCGQHHERDEQNRNIFGDVTKQIDRAEAVKDGCAHGNRRKVQMSERVLRRKPREQV